MKSPWELGCGAEHWGQRLPVPVMGAASEARGVSQKHLCLGPQMGRKGLGTRVVLADMEPLGRLLYFTLDWPGWRRRSASILGHHRDPFSESLP